jgi:hypothetical protein
MFCILLQSGGSMLPTGSLFFLIILILGALGIIVFIRNFNQGYHSGDSNVGDDDLDYLPDESKILTLLNLILTNKRLYQKNHVRDNIGVTETSLIFLEDLSSIVIITINRIWLLILGILLILFDFYLMYNNLKNEKELNVWLSEFIIILLVAICLIVAWKWTKRSFIQFMSKGGVPILLSIKGINPSLIKKVLYNVSKAKNDRITALMSSNHKIEP